MKKNNVVRVTKHQNTFKQQPQRTTSGFHLCILVGAQKVSDFGAFWIFKSGMLNLYFIILNCYCITNFPKDCNCFICSWFCNLGFTQLPLLLVVLVVFPVAELNGLVDKVSFGMAELHSPCTLRNSPLHMACGAAEPDMVANVSQECKSLIC